MKKFKIALWVILVGFIAIIFFSNKDYFMAKQSLKINFLVGEPYQLKELPNYIFFLIFFFTGFLIAYFFSLSERFKSNKKVKTLNEVASSQVKEISALKKEVESSRKTAQSHEEAPKEKKEESTA